MIPLNMVRRISTEMGVPETTIIRDYAQNIFLDALYEQQDFLVFKGGTCLRKIYFPNYRFSDDLDFTLNTELPVADISSLIAATLVLARKNSGIIYQDDFIQEQTESGLLYNTYFIYGPLNIRMKIKLDITLRSNEPICLPVKKRSIIHRYPIIHRNDPITYSIEEILSEKVRSLFQRTRPRDLYDTWFMIENGIMLTNAIERKFALKNMKMDVDLLVSKKTSFKNAWERSLHHQIRVIPEFNAVFNKVTDILEGWNESESHTES